LVLDWILIALAAYKIFVISGILQPLFWESVASRPALTATNAPIGLFLLGLFGLMGLRLPTTRWAKRGYLAIATLLMGAIAILQSWSLDSISPLMIVLLLRCCLFLERKGRWWVAAIMWLVYPFPWVIPVLVLVFFLQPDFLKSIQWENQSLATATPDGGIILTFTPEQLQQFTELLQKSIVYFLFDGLFSFGIILIFVLLLTNSLVNERQGRRKLTAAHEQLYQYSLQIEDQATLQERNRIAREIHDSLGHLLTTQTVLLQNVELSLKSNLEEAQDFLSQSRHIGSQALGELRQSISLLRTDPLQGRTLEAAIAQLCENLSQIAGIQTVYTLQLRTPLPHRIQVVVYRIVEESLTNIHKYSQASQVTIHLGLTSSLSNRSTPEIQLDTDANTEPDLQVSSACCLILKIEDNGIGFHVEQNATGFGLRGMQERAVSLGGQLQITSQPEAGCQVLLTLPLPQVTL
jgi:signal transduction histidine kinase